MGYFTPAIDKYLAHWIMPDTWHTPPDIEDRFYGFVVAIDRFSKPVRDFKADDPSLENLTPVEKARLLKRRTSRNPRTYNEKAFSEKILLAIERNHPDFDSQEAHSLVRRLTGEAMLILDALWYSRNMPHTSIQRLELTDFM